MKNIMQNTMQYIKNTKYGYLILFRENKLLIKDVASYKKFEIILDITSYLNKGSINYSVNDDLSIELKPS